MTCADVARKLNAFALGKLSDPESKAIQEHIATCDACRKAEKAERAFHQAVQITIRESDQPEAELLSMAAGYRSSPRRWIFNGIALGVGIAVPLILMGTCVLGVGFEDVLVLQHVQATRPGEKLQSPGDPETVRRELRAHFSDDLPLPKGLDVEGLRPIQVLRESGVQMLIRIGDQRVSIFLFPVDVLDRRPDLVESLGSEGRRLDTVQGYTVGMIRGRLMTALVGSVDRQTALDWLLRFRMN
ncbi:MAG TPA: zf-HC2 domain-containing protein [Planctomycetota bacterium]|nr:zf-HC2 domain-containing protein [Planctomycetota bacterium]